MKAVMNKCIWSRMASFAGSIATVVGKWRLDHLIFVVKGVAPDFRCLLVRRSFLLAAHTGVLRRQRWQCNKKAVSCDGQKTLSIRHASDDPRSSIWDMDDRHQFWVLPAIDLVMVKVGRRLIAYYLPLSVRALCRGGQPGRRFSLARVFPVFQWNTGGIFIRYRPLGGVQAFLVLS